MPAPETSAPESGPRRKIVLAALGLSALVVLGFAWSALRGSASSNRATSLTAEVKRGNLDIKVLEGGAMEALESQAIRSEVQGQTKILNLMPEGTLITEKDVAEGLILVELDKAELEDKQKNQEVQVQSLEASLTEAEQEFEIQVSANLSAIRLVEMNTRFAEMDFRKYLGEDMADRVLDVTGLAEVAEQVLDVEFERDDSDSGDPLEQTAALPISEIAGTPDVEPGLSAIEIRSTKPLPTPSFDFASLLKKEVPSDGEARQMLRDREDALLVAEEEYRISKEQFEGKQRLADRNFVTATELEAERVGLKKAEVSVDSARSKLDLFRQYEFPKMAEELLSKYQDLLMETERAKRKATSLMAQAEAKLRSAQSRLAIESQRLRELERQIERCTIRAERSGYLIYGDGRNEYWRNEQVEEGASVHERQQILTIPDMTKMSVNVKVHESAVKLVKEGMKANIRIDAYKDRPLTGEVMKVAVMPDSENRWANPDLKVFEVTLTVHGTHDWIRPGMSAQCELLVEKLVDVLYVPLPAVRYIGETAICYVKKGGGHERRTVTTGAFTNEYIQIVDGLEEGETVLLRPPAGEETEFAPASEIDSKSESDAA